MPRCLASAFCESPRALRAARSLSPIDAVGLAGFESYPNLANGVRRANYTKSLGEGKNWKLKLEVTVDNTDSMRRGQPACKVMKDMRHAPPRMGPRVHHHGCLAPGGCAVSILAIGKCVGEDDRYVIEGEVGRGGMQEVYRALDDKLQRPVALKVPQDAKVARRFRESAVISAKVNHPNVAKTLDYFEDGEGRFFLVEELVEGPNLRQITARFERLDPHATT